MHNLKNIFLWLAVVFAGFFGLCATAYALEIDGLRFGRHGEALRIVLDLDREADFRAKMETDPLRAVVDLPLLSGKPLIGRSALPDVVRDIRLEPLGTQHSRLSFLLTDPAVIRSAFLIPAEGDKPARLVLDLSPASQAVFDKAMNRAHGTLQTGSDTARTDIAKPELPFATGAGMRLNRVGTPEAPKAPKAPAFQGTGDLPLVMIDAGHGGIDSGAVRGNIAEKNITLAVARTLKKALEDTGRFRAALTRDKDTFIRLADRVRIARSADADLFVSIHADALAEHGDNVHGASFYILSEQASDAQSARLAARENDADLIAGVRLPSDDLDVKTILIDLAMRETTHQSRRASVHMAKAFKTEGIGTLPQPERAAGFMVLKSPDVPSLLIELGFLSNAREAARLNDPAYRERLAEAIARGIDGYFQAQNP